MQNNKSYEEFVKELKHDLDIYHIIRFLNFLNENRISFVPHLQ